MLTYDLEKRGRLGLYEFLYRCIRHDIVCGALRADERLPSKRSLAAHLGVSVITVEQAYAQLVAEGYVSARERSGYFVNELPTVPSVSFQGGESASIPSTSPGVLSQVPSEPAPGSPDVRPERPGLVADFTRSAPFSEQAFNVWVRALRQTAASENPADSFEGLPPKGSPRLRAAIARHLAGSRGMEVDPSRIVVGAGSQVLYGLLAQLLGRDVCFAVDDPGYPVLTSIYRAHGARVIPVPLDDQGMRVDALVRCGANVAHVMPSHQYPTGIVMGIARRYELLGWAAQAEDRYLVEDDYDCEFRLAGRPIPALASVDAAGKVVYLNTFARSISPTLRVAYMVLPPALSRRFDDELGFYANTVSAFAQVALARLIEDGSYERSIRRLRTAHRVLRDELAAAVDKANAAAGAGNLWLEEADSGLHCVLAVRTACDEHDLAARVLGEGVRLAPLGDFCHEPGNYLSLQRALAVDGAPVARYVLNYAAIPPDCMQKAMRIVAARCVGF